MKLNPKQIKTQLEAMRSERALWEDHWQELANYILPNKDEVTISDTPGVKKTNLLFDNTAIISNKLLSGALHGLLTNPHIQFFDLLTRDPKLNEQDNVRAWLQEATNKIHQVLNNSNFQTEIHEVYQDLGCFGTACMFVSEDVQDIVRFKSIPIQEYFINESSDGKVDTVYRCFKWSPKQIIQMFGEKEAPPDVIKELHKNSGKMYEIVHAVYPDIKKGPTKKWFSEHMIIELEHILDFKKLSEFPYAVSRWTKISGEKWGRSPGMDALPDAKTVNKMFEITLKGAQKTIDPALSVPDDGYAWPIRTRPGSINVRRAGSQEKIEPIFADARIDFGVQMLQLMQDKIREAFFVDQLKLRQADRMTATEVEQRTEESMRLLGPILGRQEHENLGPVVSRVFSIMMKKGLFGRIPQELSDAQLDVQYSSLIARAQRINVGRNILRGFEAMSPFFELDPNSRDVIHGDNSVKKIAKTFGWPSEMIATNKEIEETRQIKAEQEAQLQQQEAQAQQADIISKTSAAQQQG